MFPDSGEVHHEELGTTEPQQGWSATRSLSVNWERMHARTRLLWISAVAFAIVQVFGVMASSVFADARLGGLGLFFMVSVLGGVYVGVHVVSSESMGIVRHRLLLSWTTPFAIRVSRSYKPPQRTDAQLDSQSTLDESLSPVALEVFEYISLIMQDFIHSWYDDLISESEDFPTDVSTILRDASTQIVLRLSRIQRVPLLQKLVIEFLKHLTIMEKSKNSLKKLKRTSRSQESHNLVACYETFSVLHPAAMSRDLELDYIRSVAGMVMDCILPKNINECEAGVLLVREIVSQAVLLEAIDLISDPDFINKTILLLASPTQTPSSMSQRQSGQSRIGEETLTSQQRIDRSQGQGGEEVSASHQLMSRSLANGLGQLSHRRQQTVVDSPPKNSEDSPEINHNIILGRATPNDSQTVREMVSNSDGVPNASEACGPLQGNTVFQGPDRINYHDSRDPPSPPCLSDENSDTRNGDCGDRTSLRSDGNSQGAETPGRDCLTKSLHRDTPSQVPPSGSGEAFVDSGTVVEVHEDQLESAMADSLSAMLDSCAEVIPTVSPPDDVDRNEEVYSTAADISDASNDTTRASSKLTRHGLSPWHQNRFSFEGLSSIVPIPLKRRSTSPALSSLSRSADSVIDPESSLMEEALNAEGNRRCRNKSVPSLFTADSGDEEPQSDPLVLAYQGLGDVDASEGDEIDSATGTGAAAGGDEVVTWEQRYICNLSITATEQVQEHRNKKVYVLYVIEFEIRASEDETEVDSSTTVVELQVRRRYREFLTLHWKLEHRAEFKRSLRGVKNFPRRFALPIMKKDVTGIEQRRVMLEKYLKQLLNIPKIHTSQEIVDFLALNGDAHIAFVRKASSYTPKFDKILRSSLSGMKQGLKSLAPFPSARSETRTEKTEEAADAPPSNEGETEDEDPRHFEITRVCSLDPDDSKFSLIDIMPYLIKDAQSQLDHQAANRSNPSVMNIHEDTAGEPIRNSEEDGADDLWLYSCIMDTLGLLQKQPDHWMFEESVQQLLQNLCGDFVQRFVQREIWTLFSPESWALYLSLIRDEIWPDGVLFQGGEGALSPSEKDELYKEAEHFLLNAYPSVLNILVGKKQLHEGILELFKSVQNQHLNKHLMYTALDHLLDQALPELKTEAVGAGH